MSSCCPENSQENWRESINCLYKPLWARGWQERKPERRGEGQEGGTLGHKDTNTSSLRWVTTVTTKRLICQGKVGHILSIENSFIYKFSQVSPRISFFFFFPVTPKCQRTSVLIWKESSTVILLLGEAKGPQTPTLGQIQLVAHFVLRMAVLFLNVWKKNQKIIFHDIWELGEIQISMST